MEPHGQSSWYLFVLPCFAPKLSFGSFAGLSAMSRREGFALSATSPEQILFSHSSTGKARGILRGRIKLFLINNFGSNKSNEFRFYPLLPLISKRDSQKRDVTQQWDFACRFNNNRIKQTADNNGRTIIKLDLKIIFLCLVLRLLLSGGSLDMNRIILGCKFGLELKIDCFFINNFRNKVDPYFLFIQK